jgi:two-component system, NtrC family, sensor histidine kinase PilS
MAENALFSRIKALIGFRALFVTLLLGSAFLFKVEYFYAHPGLISYFIIFLYTLTIVYSLLLRRMKNLFIFAYVQLVVDVLSSIAMVYITGGINSLFSFTLILNVLSSSIVLNKKAGYVIAGLSSILYGVLLDLQFYNKLLPIIPEGNIPEKEFLYNIFIHILSFYITAYLGGYLSHRLEKTVEKLEEKDTHFKDLELFNIKVIESLPSGLFTTDIDGNVLLFNIAAEKITGIKKENIIGRSIEAALPFLKFPFESGRREEILETNEYMQIIGINISSIKDISGKDTGFIGVFQDLTQLKKLELEMKQKEKWAAIGELSANIAHEIRNPLASLKGSVEMLKEDKMPAKHREKLMDIALKEMERLNNTVTDFLTYSSPKPLEMERVDLHLLLDETLELLNNMEQKDSVLIKKEYKGPLLINADQQKLRQVFWNLGINAIEAMKTDGELIVSTGNSYNSVRISFTDTGPGIALADIEKIFYPFYTTKEHGTGLGLAIAYRIIEEHNGKLIANSNPGRKTTFEIILPKES